MKLDYFGYLVTFAKKNQSTAKIAVWIIAGIKFNQGYSYVN